MKYKKLIILAILIVSLFTVSAVSAVDNVTSDVVSVDDVTDVITYDDVASVVDLENDNVNNDNLDILESSESQEKISLDGDGDILSASSPSSYSYSVSVSDVTMNYGSSGSIPISISPASSSYAYRYDFYLKVYDSNNNLKINKNYYSTTSNTKVTHTISAYELASGTYTIKIVNYADNNVMDTAKLTVKSSGSSSSSNSPTSSAYSVTVYDTSVNYGSSGSISMSITPASSSYYKYDFYLKVYDSNGAVKISQRYYSTSAAYSKTYSLSSNSLSAGVYTIKIINYRDNNVMDTAKLTISSLPYSAYSVSVSDVSVKSGSSGSISMSITPASSSYYYRYDFYLKVYDSSGAEKISQRYYGTSAAYSKTYTLSSNSLNPGVYTIKIINNNDDHVMGTAKLTVYNIKIETLDVTGKCTENIQFRARLSENGNYVYGLSVIFKCNGKEYAATTDSQGYATLKIHLKAGTYDITTQCGGVSKKNTIKVNSVYVENDYKNVYVDSMTGYYGGQNKINYGWDGNLKAYFKIYKGNNLVYQKEVNSNGYISDYMDYADQDYAYEGSEIKSVGTYKAVITDENGNELAQASIKIDKAPTHSKQETFNSVIGGRVDIYTYVFDESDSNKNIGGTAKLKINGKTYSAKVKNGVAIFKNVKLPLKAKTYKFSVKFSGDKNYKGCSVINKIKVSKKNMVLLKKDRTIKVGKYVIKLSKKQYKSLVKALNKGKNKSIKLNTKYKYKVKVKYSKKVKKYKTTKAVKTWYASSYMPMINKMKSEGWTKVSEYTYTKANPQNKYGIGLSAYTYAVCKWVKVSYKTAYKTKSYPVKAHIYTKKEYSVPIIKIYSHGKTLKLKGIAVV